MWPVAIYWAFLTIGTPSAQYPAAIDSGSFTLDIPLKGCNGCVNTPPNHAYDPSASSSSHLFTCSLFKSCTPGGAGCSHDQCTFSNTYETCVPTNPTEPCTISGLWYSDKVTWGNSGAVTVQFGAINYQTSNFEQFQNINAVVGMAGPSNPESVIGQLASNNAIDSYVWSICLQPGSISNGTITIGGIDSRLHNGPVVYTPNTGGGQFYQMQANGLTVGNSQVYLDESQVIIDSGTNILLLPTESYTSMKQQMLAMCSSVNLHGICDVPSTKTLFDSKELFVCCCCCFGFPSALIFFLFFFFLKRLLLLLHAFSSGSVSQHHSCCSQYQSRYARKRLHSSQLRSELSTRTELSRYLSHWRARSFHCWRHLVMELLDCI